MKNLCLSLLLLAATVLSSTAQAQVINGDLNHNQGLDVEDVTLLIDGYLTGASEVIETSSNYYKEDNSLIVGTWYASKTSSIVFEADGTYGGGFPYKFIPAQGEILVFDNDGNVTFDYRVIYLADDVMILKLNDGTYLKMTRTIPPQRVTSITLSATELSLDLDGYEKLTATVLPSDADNPSVVWSSSDETVAIVSQKGMVEAVGEGTATITCTAADGSGVQATCGVTVGSKPSNHHEAVDLGLSVKWATMNVGANAPEEYGDYFAWGETNSKTDYSWENYKWCKGSDNTLTKYCIDSFLGTVDNKTTLELSDDAAHANWGGTWRMPTGVEIKELKERCSWEWTTQNSVNGYRVTGPTGNFIFLPAAGYRSGSSLSDAGGYYWYSSLFGSYSSKASYVFFDSSYVNWLFGTHRYLGQSVRAVCPNTTIQPEISLSKTSLELKAEESVQLTAIVEPSDAGTVTWTSSDERVAIVADGLVTAIANGNATITAEIPGGAATCEVIVVGTTPAPEHEAVDLGLSVKWATINVGANAPEDYGDYFAWGETIPTDWCNWSAYSWCNGSESILTKYNTSSSYGIVDNKTTLELSDDAAHANWGGTWRMPTRDEIKELWDNCSWEWTTQNGVNGRKVTGPNGNSIFLPAAGCRLDSSLNGAGSNGYYWSSSLYTDNPLYGWYLYFYPSNFSMYIYNRYRGQSVRAVCQ